MHKKISNKSDFCQISYEWPATFLDVVEWKQHEKKSGVFFHEEGVFSLWTMKVLWQADLVILIGNLPKNRDGKSAA